VPHGLRDGIHRRSRFRGHLGTSVGLRPTSDYMLPLRRLAILFCVVACDVEATDDDVVEPSLQGKGDELGGVDDGGALMFGGEASGEFTRDFQFFAYTFEARSGAVVTTEVTQKGSSAGLDTTLFVYALDDDAQPRRLVLDDDDGFGALSRIDRFRLFGAGRYAIVVGTKSAAGRGRFRVTLACDGDDCEPEAPVDTPCPKALRDGIATCLHEVSANFEFESRFDELVGDSCGTRSEIEALRDQQCADAAAPFCGDDEAVAACESFVATAYPSPDRVAPLLAEVDEPTVRALVDASNAAEACSDLGEDASCQFSGAVLRYDPAQTIALEELLAHARTRLDGGPGVAAQQDLPEGSATFDQFLEFFGTNAEGEALLDALRLDIDTARIATAFGEFQSTGADCQADLVVVQFPTEGLVLDFSVLTCSG
jgi:hypothetical protein